MVIPDREIIKPTCIMKVLLNRFFFMNLSFAWYWGIWLIAAKKPSFGKISFELSRDSCAGVLFLPLLVIMTMPAVRAGTWIICPD